jgi:Fe-S-cluster containining protein
MNEKPWYHEGLPFQCTGCGDCCTGAPGYVWVTREEIRSLAEADGVTPEEFEASFVRRVGRRKSLIEMSNGDCAFFDHASRRCRIYLLRPRQCRTYPFWQSNVRTPATWQDACRACPGCGRGPLTPLAEIQARVQVIKI